MEIFDVTVGTIDATSDDFNYLFYQIRKDSKAKKS
jgi:hypothetical protein